MAAIMMLLNRTTSGREIQEIRPLVAIYLLGRILDKILPPPGRELPDEDDEFSEVSWTHSRGREETAVEPT